MLNNNIIYFWAKPLSKLLTSTLTTLFNNTFPVYCMGKRTVSIDINIGGNRSQNKF